MRNSSTLHSKAMEMIDEIAANRDIEIRKNKQLMKEVCERAFVLEKEAAELIPLDRNNEPTRSVLYRSAGWIAFNAEMYSEALKMAQEGLKGVIHPDIEDELKELEKEAKSGLKC